ncbi:ABC transporter ATP-binding protein [Paenibacillus typhae]|uniref:ABC transporter ATP-binding protein n=1 Tax=Paenibacillus typhae TaxID=1174501 RepID=UPI001C8D0188|nr:ABC transporter ATP-binding protein [Paenibacillus typhae]MBY0011693.1 ABC transporter ATP-binding protein [Paenibacillus typhae]
MKPLIELNAVGKSFFSPDGIIQVLDKLDLLVEAGEFISIIGPSGCGKSTLLRIVAGLDVDIDGEVLVDGLKVTKPSKSRGYIFQEHRLFPWMTVQENIAADFPLKNPQVRAKVKELISLVKLEGFEQAYPKQLSGGMSQRVAIARSLLRNPKLLLLDEPFGALDAFTRSHMQEALLDIWEQNRTTMLFVTHDIDEAVFLASRVVILDPRPGRIREIVPVALPYPRDRTSEAFQSLRTRVLRSLEHKGEPEEAWSI